MLTAAIKETVEVVIFQIKIIGLELGLWLGW